CYQRQTKKQPAAAPSSSYSWQAAFLFDRFIGRHGIVHGADKKRQPAPSVNLDMGAGPGTMLAGRWRCCRFVIPTGGGMEGHHVEPGEPHGTRHTLPAAKNSAPYTCSGGAPC